MAVWQCDHGHTVVAARALKVCPVAPCGGPLHEVTASEADVLTHPTPLPELRPRRRKDT